jgi:hypothetical protein
VAAGAYGEEIPLPPPLGFTLPTMAWPLAPASGRRADAADVAHMTDPLPPVTVTLPT